MKKFSKDQEAELVRHRATIKDAVAAFEMAANVREAALGDAAAFLEPIADEAQSYLADRCEKWQESDKGGSYSAWADELQDIASELQAVDLELQDDGVIERFAEMTTAPDDA